MSLAAQTDEKSELAMVMVKMLKYIKAEKAAVEQGKRGQAYPKTFEKIYYASPTSGKVLPNNFHQLSDSFVLSVKSYHNTKENTKQKEGFNLLVQSCVACHTKVCPGPIAVIEKNLID